MIEHCGRLTSVMTYSMECYAWWYHTHPFAPSVSLTCYHEQMCQQRLLVACPHKSVMKPSICTLLFCSEPEGFVFSQMRRKIRCKRYIHIIAFTTDLAIVTVPSVSYLVDSDATLINVMLVGTESISMARCTTKCYLSSPGVCY